MNTTELRKPLIQSAVVLAGIIFLISLVGGSESTSFFGMIAAIIGGIFNIIKLVIGLSLALVFSIACLIALFFAAVALYSVEDSKKMYGQFKQNLCRLKSGVSDCECSSATTGEVPSSAECSTADSSDVSTETTVIEEQPSAPVISEESLAIKALEEQLASNLEEFQSKEKEFENSIAALSAKLEEKAEAALTEQVTGLLDTQVETSSAVATTTTRMDSFDTVLKEQANDTAKLNKTIEELQTKLDAANTDSLNLKIDELQTKLDAANTDSLNQKIDELQTKLDAANTDSLNQKIDELQTKLDAANTDSLNLKIDELQTKLDATNTDSLDQKIDELQTKLDATNTDGLDKKVDVLQKQLESANIDSFNKKIDDLQKNLDAANNEIIQLENLFTAPPEEAAAAPAKVDEKKTEGKAEAKKDVIDTEHRIFTYLESEIDRHLFAGKIQEAVNKDMTYAEIDEFLTASLSKKADTIIKDHPSLFKDYVRHTKKQS